MEGSEGVITQLGRAMWTVWGYLTGAVARFLKPEVINEADQEKKEEEENNEATTSKETTTEDQELSPLKVRDAALQWEKGHINSKDGTDEETDMAKHTCASIAWDTRVPERSSKDTDQKSQKRYNKEPLGSPLSNIGATKVNSNDFAEKANPLAFTDTDVKNQNFELAASEKADLDVDGSENSQDTTSKADDDDKDGVDGTMRSEYDGNSELTESKHDVQGLELEENTMWCDGEEKEERICKDENHELYEQQDVSDSEVAKTHSEVTDQRLESECELLETQMEDSIINVNEPELTRNMKDIFEDEDEVDVDLLTVMMESSQTKQFHKQELPKAITTSEMAAKLIKSQRPNLVTKQHLKGVDTQLETSTGNQNETVETAAKCRKEVAAEDVNKSVNLQASPYTQHVGEVELQQRIENESTIFTETTAEVSEMKCEQAVSESDSSNPVSDSSTAEATTEFCKQSAEIMDPVFDICEKPGVDQLHHGEPKVQNRSDVESKSQGLQGPSGFIEKESELTTLEMKSDSPKVADKHKGSEEKETGLLDEINSTVASFGVTEEVCELTKQSEEDVKQSAGLEEHEHPIHGEGIVLQETMEKKLVQGESPGAAFTVKEPLCEIKISSDQVDETTFAAVDKVESSDKTEWDLETNVRTKAKLMMVTKSNSTEQIHETFDISDMSNYTKTGQAKSEASTQIQAIAASVVEEVMSRLTHESEEDVKMSAELEKSSAEYPIYGEEMVLQETMDQCSLEQETVQEKSADGQMTELLLKAPLSEIKFISSQQVDKSTIASTDKISSSAVLEMDKTECEIENSVRSETELLIEIKNSSTEQIHEMFDISDMSNYTKTEQAKSESGTPEIQAIAASIVEEVMNSLTKDSEEDLKTSAEFEKTSLEHPIYGEEMVLQETIDQRSLQQETVQELLMETKPNSTKQIHEIFEVSDMSNYTTTEQAKSESGTPEIQAIAASIVEQVMSTLTQESKEDLKTSAEFEKSSYEHPIEGENVVLQEILGECAHEQGIEKEKSSDEIFNESSLKAPLSEIKTVTSEQVDETTVASTDKIPSSAVLEMDKPECSIETTVRDMAELMVETKSETASGTSEIKAIAASVVDEVMGTLPKESEDDEKRSAELEQRSLVHPIYGEEMVLQETMDQCSLEQETVQEKSADGQMTELLLKAPLSEIKFISSQQVDKSTIASTDKISSSAVLEMDKTECEIENSVRSETELLIEIKNSSTEQIHEMFDISDMSNYTKTEQAKSESGTPEIQAIAASIVEEVMNSLTKDSEEDLKTSAEFEKTSLEHPIYGEEMVLQETIDQRSLQQETVQELLMETKPNSTKQIHEIFEVSDMSNYTTTEQAKSESGTPEIQAIAASIVEQVMSTLTQESKEDLKTSAEFEKSSYEHPIEGENVVLQEILGECAHEQEIEQEKSSDEIFNESSLKAPLSEIKTVTSEQVDETTVASTDKIPSSAVLEMDKPECSIETTVRDMAELMVETKSETASGTSEIKAIAASVVDEVMGTLPKESEDDEKRSAELEQRSLVHPIYGEEMVLQETMDQCSLEQETVQEKSADGQMTELLLKAPLSEIKFISSQQVDKSTIASTDKMPSSAALEMDKTEREIENSVRSETELLIEIKNSSTEQIHEMFDISDMSNYTKTEQAKSESDTPEIQAIAASIVEEVMSTLTKHSEEDLKTSEEFEKSSLEHPIYGEEMVLQETIDQRSLEQETVQELLMETKPNSTKQIQEIFEVSDMSNYTTTEQAKSESGTPEIQAIAASIVEQVMSTLTQESKEDLKTSAEFEKSSYEHPIEGENVVLQEILGECAHEQEIEQEKSTDEIFNESSLKAPLIEIKTVTSEQVDETTVASTDKIPSSAVLDLDQTECATETSVGSETELLMETISSLTEQKHEMLEVWDMSNYTETEQAKSEIQAIAASVVEEVMSTLAQESEQDVKKSAEFEKSSHEYPIEGENAAVQETLGQCYNEQGIVKEKTSNEIFNELSLKAPLSEVKSVSSEQVDETTIASNDKIPSSTILVMDIPECVTETSVGSMTELMVETKSETESGISEIKSVAALVVDEVTLRLTKESEDDGKSSAELEKTSIEHPIYGEEVDLQEKMDPCSLEQETVQELLMESKPKSTEQIHEMFEASDMSNYTTNEQAISESGTPEIQAIAASVVEEVMSRLTQESKEDVKTSAEFEKSSYEHPVEGERKVLQETMDQRFLKQEIVQEKTAEAEIKELLLKSETSDKAESKILDEMKDIPVSLEVMGEAVSGLGKGSEERPLSSERDAPEISEERNEFQSEVEMLETDTSIMQRNITSLMYIVDNERNLEEDAADIKSEKREKIEGMNEMEEEILEGAIGRQQVVPFKSEASKEMSTGHEQVDGGVLHSNTNMTERGKAELKRERKKMEAESKKDKLPALTDLLPPKALLLDFTVQKSKIAVKNPLVRPPKDPRMLINMASVEPLTSPQSSRPSPPKKSHVGELSVPSKGVIGFRLPGLGAGLPTLRKTEAGIKIRDVQSEVKQECPPALPKSSTESTSTEDHPKQEQTPTKPKWTPPKHPGMGSPMMMAELKNKLKKPGKQ